ncbi:hypothetical protein I317_00520 [Kwoniella heveanensis CBS 569]|nr:hypothetical protein I317_00520 [Kwoniella heveanensis CBS 569]
MTATAPGSDFDSSNPFGAGNGPSPMRTTEDVDSSYEGSVRSSRRGPPSSGGDSIETLEGWENDSPGTRTPTAASRTHGHEQGQTSGDVSPRTLPASTAGGDAPPVSASEYGPQPHTRSSIAMASKLALMRWIMKGDQTSRFTYGKMFDRMRRVRAFKPIRRIGAPRDFTCAHHLLQPLAIDRIGQTRSNSLISVLGGS